MKEVSMAQNTVQADSASPEQVKQENKTVWMLRISNVPTPLEKVGVKEIFEKHGKVLEVTGVGEIPYTAFDVTMETEQSRQKAFNALNGKSAPGFPRSTLRLMLQKTAEQILTQKLKLCKLIEGFLEFKNEATQQEVLHDVTTKLDDKDFNNLKTVITKVMDKPHAKVTDKALQYSGFKNSPDFINTLKKKNAVNDWIWKLEDQIEGRKKEFLVEFQEDLTDKIKRCEELSVDKLLSVIFRNYPEVQLKEEVRKRLDLPDVALQWINISPFTMETKEEDMKRMLRPHGTVEYVIMQDNGLTFQSALVKMKTVEMAEEVVINKRKKPLGGEKRPLRITRYYGKIAMKTYPLNCTKEPQKTEESTASVTPGQKRPFNAQGTNNGPAPKRGNFQGQGGRGRGGGEGNRGRGQSNASRGGGDRGRGGAPGRGGRGGIGGRGGSGGSRGGIGGGRGGSGGGRGGIGGGRGGGRGGGQNSASRGRGGNNNQRGGYHGGRDNHQGGKSNHGDNRGYYGFSSREETNNSPASLMDMYGQSGDYSRQDTWGSSDHYRPDSSGGMYEDSYQSANSSRGYSDSYSYDRGAGSYDRDAGSYDRGAGSYDRDAGSYDRGAGSYDRGAVSYDRGAGSYDRGAGSYERGAGSYERGAGSYGDYRNGGSQMSNVNTSSASIIPKPSAVLSELQQKLQRQNLIFSDSMTTSFTSSSQGVQPLLSSGGGSWQQGNNQHQRGGGRGGGQRGRGRFAGYNR